MIESRALNVQYITYFLNKVQKNRIAFEMTTKSIELNLDWVFYSTSRSRSRY